MGGPPPRAFCDHKRHFRSVFVPGSLLSQIIKDILRHGIAGIIIFRFGGGITELFKNLMINKNPFRKKKKNVCNYLSFSFWREAHSLPTKMPWCRGRNICKTVASDCRFCASVPVCVLILPLHRKPPLGPADSHRDSQRSPAQMPEVRFFTTLRPREYTPLTAVTLLDIGFSERGCGAAALGRGCFSQWLRGSGALGLVGDPDCSRLLQTMKPDSALRRLQSSHAQVGINFLCHSR